MSAFDWILAIDGYPKFCLINPFTRAQIQLPPLDTFPDVLRFDHNKPNEEYFIYGARRYIPNQKTYSKGLAYFREIFVNNVVLSSNPASNEFMVMAIYDELGEFAFCRSGDKKWSKLKVSRFAEDVMSYEGKFYDLTRSREVWIGDAISLPQMTRIAPHPSRHVPNECWLVRMTSGELVFVNMKFKWKPIVDDPEEREYYKTTHLCGLRAISRTVEMD
ncbi:uncharacterized protein LOC132178169 [Corylus avellana]|uniref:uncharacterized protein LOC132178169 n=1 Tax=Corylus avellana TaxID=13451 RepID=UPI00286BD421|nr:uncharacterized protein LOC132178169 [Corylus avellana]